MRSWKESLYRVYRVLEEQAKKGEKEISINKLALLTDFSPLYLKIHLIPSLTDLFPCIKMSKGKVIFDCGEH
ncbi:MAG: hypothetical protein QXW45_06890 [Thermosphaera sp.]